MQKNLSAAFSMVALLCTFFLAIPSAALALSPSPAAASTPTEYVRDAVDHALNTLRDNSLDSKIKGERIRALLTEKFDLPGMAQSMVGRKWMEQTPAKQAEFAGLFAALLERTYARNITIAKDLRVVYVGEHLDEDRAEVDTAIPYKGESLPVSYRLHRLNGAWKIYDLHVAHISLVSNYRAQFRAIISQSSFDELLRRMHQKIEGKE